MPEERPTESTSEAGTPGMTGQLTSVLNRLRQRIRAFVVVDGLATLLIWASGLFLVALAIDYLPVLFGLSELPRLVRWAFLGALIGGSVYVFNQLIVKRLVVPISQRSLALLIERYHANFKESLVTTVELQDQQQGDTSNSLYEEARQTALNDLQQVELSRVFNRRRQFQRVGLASVLLIVIAVLGVFRPEALSLGAQRLLLLQDTPWPRRANIEVIGVRVVQDVANPVLQGQESLLSFDSRQVKVAKGAKLVLVVQANGPTAERPKQVIPGRCIVYYRTDDGQTGYQYMDRVGAERDGKQLFEFAGTPFRGVTDDITFDVRGEDHRVNQFVIDVVDSPTIAKAEVDCAFPDYMVDLETGAWTPRSLVLESGLRLPVGTKASLKLQANKPLKQAWAYDPETKETLPVRVEVGTREVTIPLEELAADVALEVTLEDVDGVVSDVPYRAELLAFEDQAPDVDARIVGIGDAITPEARVPFSGAIEDDFGVAEAWIDVAILDQDTLLEPFQLGAGGQVEAALDLRQKRQERVDAFALTPDEGKKLTLSVSAEDRFNLGSSPNVGRGDTYELEIVSPSQLLRRLERKEAAQRRLLVQIYDELTDAHNLLVRVRGQSSSSDDFREPGDAAGSGDEAPLNDLDQSEVNLVFTQRAWLQLQKSRQEIDAIANTFDNIRLQLINNRVESEDRKQRIMERIIEPLQAIVNDRIPLADEQVLATQRIFEQRIKQADSVTAEAVEQQVSMAIDEMQLLLVDVDTVLQEMLKFESYNELLDVVRELIRQQEALLEKTEKERKRQAFEDLLK